MYVTTEHVKIIPKHFVTLAHTTYSKFCKRSNSNPQQTSSAPFYGIAEFSDVWMTNVYVCVCLWGVWNVLFIHDSVIQS